MTQFERSSPVAPSARYFVILAILVPTILVGFALFLGNEYARSEASRLAARQSAEVAASALELRAAIRQAETAQRGYILTHDPQFLAPYRPARDAAHRQFDVYRTLTGDAAVGEIVAAKFAEMDQVLALGGRGAWAAAQVKIADGEGLALMSRIERLLQAQIARSDALTRANRERNDRRSQIVQQWAWLLVGLTTLALLVGLYLLWATRTQRWTAAIAEHEALTRHRTILNSTSDAIVILNPSGSIERVNAAATRLLGYDAGDLERRDVSCILDIATGEGTFHERVGIEDDRLRTRLLVDRAAYASDGSTVPVDVALGLMALPDGLHVVASIRDMSDRKAVERMKDEFIATVSHELRTPLTSVVGSLGLLRAGTAGALPDAAQELVTIAENNARRLIRLTNDILDLEKLSSGAMTFEMGEVDLADVARETAQAYSAVAQARGVRIALEAPDGPLKAVGDRQRLLQAAGNLLANAIRHTPEGSEVTIATRLLNDRPSMSISDHGSGVPLEFRDRIFERFGQVPSQQVSGTGLGLAIVREIIDGHDGSVWYEDAPGGGATFAFAIDRPRAEQVDTVLLLSQDRDTISRISAIVAADGVAVHAVTSIDAVEQAAHSDRPPSLLLFDLDMASSHADDFWVWLNRDPDLGGIPRAIVSQSLLARQSALPFEIVAWFSKPIDEAAVRSLVQDVRLNQHAAGAKVILHVEDDRDLRTVMATALAGEGELLTAGDLASARRILQDRTPDIVILDLALPDGSGVELLPDLVDRQGRPIPVVVHSAQAVSSDVVTRASAVVTKSRIAFPELRTIIRSIVDDQGEES